MSVYLIVPALPAAWQIETLSSCAAGVLRAARASAPATVSAKSDRFHFFIAGSFVGEVAVPGDSVPNPPYPRDGGLPANPGSKRAEFAQTG